jgi:predicted nucleotidyltransferase
MKQKDADKALWSIAPEVYKDCILGGYRGSIAHGTYIPSDDPKSIDDKDIMGIVIPPTQYYLGLKSFGSRGTKEIFEGQWDAVFYEARKAMTLLGKGNPNVLSLLWLPETLYFKKDGTGQYLINNRHIFVGKHVYNAYVGYARAQLAKMERSEFKGYMGDRRKKLVEKYGYDTKNASHLIRLLRQGIEFLSTGELVVQRPDAAELLAIKKGEWSLKRVKEESEFLFKYAYEALVHSDLPDKPDQDIINAVCVNMVSKHLYDKAEL